MTRIPVGRVTHGIANHVPAAVSPGTLVLFIITTCPAQLSEPKHLMDSYTDDEDYLILEDESGRLRMNAPTDVLPVTRLVTGGQTRWMVPAPRHAFTTYYWSIERSSENPYLGQDTCDTNFLLLPFLHNRNVVPPHISNVDIVCQSHRCSPPCSFDANSMTRHTRFGTGVVVAVRCTVQLKGMDVHELIPCGLAPQPAIRRQGACMLSYDYKSFFDLV